MTYSEIRAALRNLGGQPSGGDFDTMADSAINRYYRMILAYVDQDEQTREFTLTTVASTQDYGLPTYVKRVLNIEDATARRSVAERTPRDYNKKHPGTTVSGSARQYHILGNYGVEVQPAAAGTVTVVSSEATDASNRYVRVKGFDSSGRLIDEQLTLNGTSTVTSTNSFASVETCVKSVASGSTITGYITVKTGTTTLAVIPYWDTMSSHLWIRMYPIPDDARALTVQSVMRKEDLVRDDDWPQFDPDYHHLLVSGPASELLPTVGKNALAGKMMSDYQENLATFKGTQSRRPNRAIFFADVTNAAILPDRPLIEGVDYL